MDGEETFLLQTAETGKRTPNKLRPQGERRYPCIFMYKMKGQDDLINLYPPTTIMISLNLFYYLVKSLLYCVFKY